MAAEKRDQFSRANCFNNESITYNYYDPHEWRMVASWHYDTAINNKAHYVTENPLAYIIPGNPPLYMHYYTLDDWHGGVHGAVNSSEPNPDGLLTPGVTTRWLVRGVHKIWINGKGESLQRTQATDCNLHFEQIY